MKSASPWGISLLRFSLRSLFVLVTAICVFLGYELNWIHQRRAFVDEQFKTRRAAWQLYYDFREAERINESASSIVYDDDKPRSPSLMWMFGEKGVCLLRVAIPERDVTKINNDEFAVSATHPTIRRAKALFPEAILFPFTKWRNEQRRVCVEVTEQK